MTEEIDYLVCRNCDTPCYVFEVDAKGRITSALCQICGADEPSDFTIPDVDDVEADD